MLSEGPRSRPRVAVDLVRGMEDYALISPASARVFGPILRDFLERKVRTEGWRLDAKIWEDLETLEALASRARHADARGRGMVATTAAAWSPANVEQDSGRELTVSEAAELLGIPRRVMARRVDRGSIPHRKNERGLRMVHVNNLVVGE